MNLGDSAARASARARRWTTAREHTTEQALNSSDFDACSVAKSLRSAVVDVDSAEDLRYTAIVKAAEVVERTSATGGIAHETGEVLQWMLAHCRKSKRERTV